MRLKRYVVEFNTCSDCPKCYSDVRTHWCLFDQERQIATGVKYVEYIPDWCPLPDAEEEEKK